MQQGKFFEAYGMLERQYKLGPELHFAPVLVNYYASLMQTDEGERADKIRDELIAVLEEKFGDSSDEIGKYATHLRLQSKYFEAILFYQIALHFAGKFTEKLVDAGDTVQECAGGLSLCIIQLFEKKPGLKNLLKNHVVVWFEKAVSLVEKSTIGEVLTTLIQSNILGISGKCRVLIREVEDAKVALKEAIRKLEDNPKIKEEDFGMYAEQLAMLGCACHATSNTAGAVENLTKAIDANKKGKDAETWKKRSEIRKYEELLKKLREHM